MYKAYLILFLILTSTLSAFELANKNASETAKQVYHYISTRNSFDENRVFAGQNCGHGPEIQDDYPLLVESLYQETGSYPALVGIDYEYVWAFSPADLSRANEVLIEHWNNGGLVTINWAPRNPWTGEYCGDLTDADLIELLDPGSAVSSKWRASLDRIAGALAELRDAGVIVIWRPLQELNGDWFWWGADAHPNDPEPLWNLWRDMFTYFSEDKGLDNLIWEISIVEHYENGHGLDWYYPGDDYVDMVGTSVYKNTYVNNNYYAQLAFGKPIAACETGPDHCCMDGTWDNMTMINNIRDHSPHTAYFHNWHDWPDHYVAIVSNQNASQLMNDPWVISRDEVNWRPDASNQMPTVVLTSPAAGTEVHKSDTVIMTANASDADGSVIKVQFCNGYEIFGEDDAAPYEFSYRNVPAGTLHLNARAIDDNDAVTVSRFINIESISNEPEINNLLQNYEFDTGLATWYWWAEGTTDYAPHADGTGKLSGQHSARADIIDGGADSWRCSLMQGFKLEKGAEYNISFQAVANSKAKVDVMFQQGPSPYTEYWKKTVTVDTVAKTFGPYVFKCNINQDEAEFKWRFGGQKNKIVWVDSAVVFDQTTVNVGSNSHNPAHFELSQNYPNPFNPSTAISFDIPRGSEVKLCVFDLRGRLVSTLVDEHKAAGRYTVDYADPALPSGAYFYQLTVGDFSQTRKMLLIR